MVADIEELEEMDAPELHAHRLNAKEVLTPMKGDIFIFPVADGTANNSGEDKDLGTSTLILDSPDRGDEQKNLPGEADGSSSTPRQDSSWYDGEAKSDFWSISGDFIYRRLVDPRVKLYVPTEESFPIPLKYIGVVRTTDTTSDVMSEKRVEDYWNVDGEKELSGAWTGFTRFLVLIEKPPDGYTWSGWRLTRKQTTSRPDTVWPDMWKHMSVALKRKEKQKWAIEKPKLDDAIILRGIFFIEPNDEEFKRIVKNARRKLEIPMPAARPCKTSLFRSGRATCRATGGHKTKYVCIVEADEPVRIRMEGTPHRYHDFFFAGKGMLSVSHYNSVHKFIPMPQAV